MTVVIVGLVLLLAVAVWRIKLTEIALLAMPFMFYVPGSVMLNMSLADFLVPILLVQAALVSTRSPSAVDNRIGRYVLWSAIFLAVSLFTSVVILARTDGLLAIVTTLKLLIGLLFFASLAILLRRDVMAGNLRFLRAWSLVSVVICLLTLADVALGTSFLRNYSDVRASGTFEDPNLFGVYLILSLTVHVMVLAQRWNLVALLGIALTPIAVVATGSRAAVFTLAAIALCLLIVTRGRARISIMVVVVFSAAAARVLVANSWIPAWERLQTSSSDIGSDSRFDLWGAAWSAFLERPILGVGSAEMLETTGHVVHNTYLSLLAAYGLVGLLILGRLPTAVFVRSIRQARTKWFGILAIGFVGLAIEMASLDLQNVRFVWAYLAIGLAVLYSSQDHETPTSTRIEVPRTVPPARRGSYRAVRSA